MTEKPIPLATFYEGWETCQQRLVTTITPLSPDQLALRAAPHLFSISMFVRHIIAIRVGWFHLLMGEGSPDLAPLWQWDKSDEPQRTAAELIAGLEATWQMIQDALARWTPADLEQRFQDWYPGEEYRGDEPWYSRQWIIWHILEHDLQHGGEISLTLGLHGLASQIEL